MVPAPRLILLPLWACSLAACGPTTVHVHGVMQQSSDLRPIGSVPLGGYQQMRVFVHPAVAQSGTQTGSSDCSVTPLEGTAERDGLDNVACVPADTLNASVTLVRQRLRAYGFDVARDRNQPFDYDVAVFVRGEAPHRADATAAQAFAQLTFSVPLGDLAASTLLGSIDRKAAADAFGVVGQDCALKDASLSSFSGSATTPMTPDFDVVSLTSEVVDDLLGCADMARFFAEARTRFPKATTATPAATSAASPASPAPDVRPLFAPPASTPNAP